MVSVLLLAVLSALVAREAAARVPKGGSGRSMAQSPSPILPLAGERVSVATGRFDVSPGPEAADLRIVIARFPFTPRDWTSLPDGPAWKVIPYRGQPVPLDSLGLVDQTDAKVWWAVTWTDLRTGALRASEARELTVVPRFANRVAPDRSLRPSARGRLPERVPTRLAERGTIELAAGYALVPGGPAAHLPASLKREVAREEGTVGAFIVQFADGSPDAARARIVEAGGRMAWPLAGVAYLVRMGPEALARLQAAGGEPWIVPYEPAYKLSRALDVSAPGRVAVTALLFEDGDGDATMAGLRALGAVNLASHRGDLNHLVRFELDRARLVDAAALPDLAWIEPTPEYAFSNDRAQWVVQSGVQGYRPVTNRGIRGLGQVVMTSDSGIRTNHEMFNDSTQSIAGWGDYPTHRKVIAYKPASSSPVIAFGDDVSYDYHGTHTAGTVAGDPSPSSTAPWAGMATDARIYFMDVAGRYDDGFGLPADLNDLYRPSYAGNAGGAARISSNSWGAFVQGAYTLSSMQTDQFAWSHPDYLMVFASGNVGVFASVNAPGTAKNCLTVGATGNGTNQSTLAPFSSRGPAADGRRKPTVMAPGDPVTSSIGSTRYTYAAYSGTSMATPAVAGAMALARQYLTEGWYPTGAPVASHGFEPSAALLRAMAVAAGRNDVAGYRVPDNVIGYGRLTLDDVLHFPGDSSRTLLVDHSQGLSDRDYVEYQVQVIDPSRPLKIALCWTDVPGHPASQVQLVNDLDLVVTHDGTTYRGNYVLNYVSQPGGSRDSLNVEEIVRFAAPSEGLWTVRVDANRVVQGPQPFALCITGGVGGPGGAIALDRHQYGLTDTLEIEVIDTNVPGPLTAQVSSTTEPWPSPVTLTGTNGVFRGSIPIAPVLAQINDGILAVTSGDLVTVTYSGTSPAVTVAATARVNVLAPTITDVRATALGASQVVVSWTTDVLASSQVRFGAGGALATAVDSAGYSTQHAVLLTGLQPLTTYRYDVESATPAGDASVDSLSGAHRSFSTRRAGTIALLMDDPDPAVLETWNHALATLGWDVDVYPAAANDPPLVGNSSAGLRRYQAVLWQVGQNNYPPFSDAQRAAIDSLLNGGGRLLVTGHDIGYGLSDAGSPSYTPEREAWLESGLKTRYYLDNFPADTLTGVAGSPVSGAYTGSIPYILWLYPDSGDNIGAAPGSDGVWSGDWIDNYYENLFIGMHWESNGPRGTAGVGVWGGQRSRLVGLYYEWRALAGSATSHLPLRTAVLGDAVAWLLGHRPPEVHLTQPLPGAVVTGDFLPIRFSARPDSGRVITGRWLDYSLDGGDTWAPLTTAACTDSGCIWDLAGALGGPPTPNSPRALLRVRAADNGAPALQTTAQMSGTFTLVRSGGDTGGPVPVGGSVGCSPVPVRRNRETTLFATFSDAETGGGTVAAAEYSVGDLPVPAGSGTPMSGSFGGPTAQASAVLATANVLNGTMTLWVRARDGAGNWGTATALTVPTSGSTVVAVDDRETVDFLAAPSPNPFVGRASIRFGLARAGEARLELFDLAGRRIQTLASGMLAAGPHVATWDGRDHGGHHLGAGIYFVRLTTPSQVFHGRIVALN